MTRREQQKRSVTMRELREYLLTPMSNGYYAVASLMAVDDIVDHVQGCIDKKNADRNTRLGLNAEGTEIADLEKAIAFIQDTANGNYTELTVPPGVKRMIQGIADGSIKIPAIATSLSIDYGTNPPKMSVVSDNAKINIPPDLVDAIVQVSDADKDSVPSGTEREAPGQAGSGG